jgi:hypothetical protein
VSRTRLLREFRMQKGKAGTLSVIHLAGRRRAPECKRLRKSRERSTVRTGMYTGTFAGLGGQRSLRDASLGFSLTRSFLITHQGDHSLIARFRIVPAQSSSPR